MSKYRIVQVRDKYIAERLIGWFFWSKIWGWHNGKSHVDGHLTYEFYSIDIAKDAIERDKSFRTWQEQRAKRLSTLPEHKVVYTDG